MHHRLVFMLVLLVFGTVAGCKKSESDGGATSAAAVPAAPAVKKEGFGTAYETGSTIWGTFTCNAVDDLACVMTYNGIAQLGASAITPQKVYTAPLGETVWELETKAYLPGDAVITMVRRGGQVVSEHRLVVNAPPTGSGPELVIESITIPQPLYEGSYFTAEVVVANLGNRPARLVGVSSLLNGYPVEFDRLTPMLGVVMVSPCRSPPSDNALYPAPSDFPTFSAGRRTFTVSSRVGEAGSYRLEVRVRDDNVVLETNETNNTSTVTFEVVPFPQR